MPKKTLVTEAHLAYLRKAVEEEVSYAAMARHIGVCTDTCKRILHKHDIVQFSGAKFIAAKPLEVVTWTRPCSGCGDKSPRPKWHYFCNSCKKQRGMLIEE